MSTYAIGDIQGCFSAFERLLAAIEFDPKKDRLWLAGDLINRGPDSLATLRYCYQQRNSITAVLGNHDLHLLAVAHEACEYKNKDTFADILAAPDRHELLHWLRHNPLYHRDKSLGYVMVHAGIHPRWSRKKAKKLAREVEAVIQGEQFPEFLANMYGNQPAQWSDELAGSTRWRYITNCFTRMRLCDSDSGIDLSYKGGLAEAPKNRFPWYNTPHRKRIKDTILFGHWAALNGVTGKPDIVALDTGCVWGNKLSALCLESRIWTQINA
ncbi:bis(5'-nucleosyl)-tetraphosphatase (symmetrical) [Gammaproteobacteria bacterium 45_16_T64]|nr:bis(5'-nucleosyl)-tetraphosphatase (symmetrical) [Gammaproteobacteria bacterium 45_16_T64]